MADFGMFAPAKRAFTKIVQNWRQQNKDKMLDEVEFVNILAKANQVFINPEAIKNGFRATGIHPLNVENIHFDRCFGQRPIEVLNECFNSDVIADSNLQLDVIADSDLQPATKTHSVPTFDKYMLHKKLDTIEKSIESMREIFNNNSDAQLHLAALVHHTQMLKRCAIPESLDSNSLLPMSKEPSKEILASSSAPAFIASGSHELARLLSLPVEFSRSTKKS